MMSNSNFKDFNITGGDNFNSVHELINTYGMEAMPQAMEILFNEAMRLEREHHQVLDIMSVIVIVLIMPMAISQNALKRVLVNQICLCHKRETVIFIPTVQIKACALSVL